VQDDRLVAQDPELVQQPEVQFLDKESHLPL
jgi:hypothetical protein